jgi:hypothetical protein
MVRGGQRHNAGRKSTWESGAKFEDTIPVRVPKNIKNELLDVAHKLDVGEDIIFASNPKIQDIESKLLSLQSEIQQLFEQFKKAQFDLETKSKDFQIKFDFLQKENLQLKDIVNTLKLPQENLVTESEKNRENLVTESITSTQLDLLELKDNINNINLHPLNSAELSKRFNKGDQFVKQKKMYYKDRPEDFLKLLKESDPQGISWQYSELDRKYHPILNN